MNRTVQTTNQVINTFIFMVFVYLIAILYCTTLYIHGMTGLLLTYGGKL